MAQGVLLLVSQNFTEQEVMDMPLDKYHLYLKAHIKNFNIERASYVADTAQSIGVVFSDKPKEALAKYTKSLTQ